MVPSLSVFALMDATSNRLVRWHFRRCCRHASRKSEEDRNCSNYPTASVRGCLDVADESLSVVAISRGSAVPRRR